MNVSAHTCTEQYFLVETRYQEEDMWFTHPNRVYGRKNARKEKKMRTEEFYSMKERGLINSENPVLEIRVIHRTILTTTSDRLHCNYRKDI